MFDCIVHASEFVCVSMCLLGPGSVAEGLSGYMQMFSLPHEVGSSLRTEPNLPLHSPFLPPHHPFLESPERSFSHKLFRAIGTSWDHLSPASDLQAHWRGYRQRKIYLERLQYLKANTNAVIKVAPRIWVGFWLS